MKIVVLAGGLSTERDVSLASGAGICRALLSRGHEAVLIDLFMGIEWDMNHLSDVFTLKGSNLEIADTISTVEPDLKAIKAARKDQSDSLIGENVIELCRLADITFLGLHGGIGENGQLQAAFDVLGIKYTGPNYLGSAIAMDKGITKQIFQKNNIPTPGGTWLRKEDKDTSLEQLGLTLPVVVKPCSGGSSIGVFIPETKEAFEQALTDSFKYEDEVIIEPYIKGREFACGYIDGKALPIIEIVPKDGFFDYSNKYQADGATEICPANIPEDIAMRMQTETVRACKALKLDVYSRADFLLTDNGDIFCLEVNTLPGMTATSLMPQEAKAAGICYEDLCELIIEKSLERN